MTARDIFAGLFAGTDDDCISQECVLCGRRYKVHRAAGKSKPHQCPQSVLSTYDEADRLATLLDDPEGPDLEEMFPDRRALDRFARHGLLLEER